MATLKQRMHKKNSSGTYDTVHLETSSSLVLRPSGRTVEQDLADYLPKTQASDTPPSTLPFGTLLTGSTIGTNNEKSTKVWTGDAENTPVELVAYNSDGTLPTNQVYDDIVTDANIAAPAIVDINSNNHAEIKYTSVDKGYVPLPNTSVGITNTNSIPISPTEILNVGVGSSGGEYNTYIWVFDHKAAQNKRYVNITGYKATRAIDISDYMDNMVLLLGTTKNDGPIAYAFINTETLQYTSLHTISDVDIEQESVAYHESAIYFSNSIYIINHNNKSTLNAHKFTLSGYDSDSLLLSYSSVTTFTGTATYHLGKQLTESGSPNKVAFIGILYSPTETTKFWYYTILTLGETPSFTNEVYVDQTSVEPSEYRYSEGLITNTVNIDFLTVSKEYCFCACTSAANSNESDRNRNPLLVRFTYNDNNTLSLTTNKLSNTSWYKHVVLCSAEDNKYIYVYFINTVSSNYSSSIYLLVINKITLQTVGDLHSNITATSNLSQIHYQSTIEYNRCRTNIINGTHIVLTYIPGTTNNSGVTACTVMCNYDDNGTLKLGFYPNNTSTKALAVTSGNIGDTVRIAYEGTYHVPGVPTGSIYNTDTSYAIAKKSGVLTVSEPWEKFNKVYYGAYVGDGSKGISADRPMSITFPFKPRLLILIGYSRLNDHGIDRFSINSGTINTQVQLTGISTTFSLNDGALRNGITGDWVYHKLTPDGLTYSWYVNTSNVNKFTYAHNVKDYTYHYIIYE